MPKLLLKNRRELSKVEFRRLLKAGKRDPGDYCACASCREKTTRDAFTAFRRSLSSLSILNK